MWQSVGARPATKPALLPLDACGIVRGTCRIGGCELTMFSASGSTSPRMATIGRMQLSAIGYFSTDGIYWEIAAFDLGIHLSRDRCQDH